MPSPSTTAPSTGLWRRIFSGTPTVNGWIGVLIYGVLVLVGFTTQGKLLRAWLPGMGGTSFYVLVRVLQLAEILLFAWIAASLERKSFAAYGLPWRPALRIRFWQGAAFGIVSLSALVLTLSALGGLRLTPPAHVGPEAPLVGAGYLLLFIILALREEFLYRGYGLSTLAGNIGFWPSAVIWSGWFMASHANNSGETGLGLATVGLFGVLACLLLRITGNLWMPIGFHAAWNWGETFLFGVGDSGHAAAPLLHGERVDERAGVVVGRGHGSGGQRAVRGADRHADPRIGPVSTPSAGITSLRSRRIRGADPTAGRIM
jgi:membrane protease YdiL (CAAX protease family)